MLFLLMISDAATSCLDEQCNSENKTFKLHTTHTLSHLYLVLLSDTDRKNTYGDIDFFHSSLARSAISRVQVRPPLIALTKLFLFLI